MLGFDTKTTNKFSITTSKKNLIEAIDDIESVLRAWYTPDYDKNQKHACVLRSIGNDLVLEVGFDSVNKSDTIYTRMVAPDVCSKSISSMMFHNQLRGAVEKCDDSIVISGLSNDDGGPLFINEYKVPRMMVNPWSLGPDYNAKQFTVPMNVMIIAAGKTWHGFDRFGLERDRNGLMFYAQGTPEMWNYDDCMGIGYVSKIGEGDDYGGFTLTVGSIKAMKALAQVKTDINSNVDVRIQRDGIIFLWNGGWSRVTTKGSKDPGYIEVVSSRSKLSLRKPASFFPKFTISNLSYSGRRLDGEFIDYSQSTIMGSYVDCSVRSVSGNDMTINASNSVIRFFYTDVTGSGRRADIDLNLVLGVVPMISYQLIGIVAEERYIVIVDGDDRYLVSDFCEIPDNHMEYNEYFKRNKMYG